MEFKDIKATLDKLGPSPYPEFIELWERSVDASGIARGKVEESIISGSTPQAHYAETSDCSTIRSYGNRFWVENLAGRYTRGVAQLAFEAEVSEPTVKRHIAALRNAGLVRVDRRKSKSSSVVLLLVGGLDFDDWLAYCSVRASSIA